MLLSNASASLCAYGHLGRAGCLITLKSTIGYIIFLGDSPISWQCKNQSLHSHSFGGAEYRAMATTASEIIWHLRLLHDLKVRCTSLVPFFCDNQIAIHIVAH